MLIWSFTGIASAFPGYYAGSPTDALYNVDSEVAIARQGTRTTMTFRNRYAGSRTSFAMLLPVPVLLGPYDVRAVDGKPFEDLSDYTRLRVSDEYSGCGTDTSTYTYYYHDWTETWSTSWSTSSTTTWTPNSTEFLAGSYDVVILSEADSAGIVDWLDQSGYATSQAARDLLQQYADEGWYFLAVEVALDEVPGPYAWAHLEPLQISYDSPSFGLPLRISALNSGGCAEDLTLYFLTDRTEGRVAISNLPEATLPLDCVWDDQDFRSPSELYNYERATSLASQPGPAWVTDYAWPGGGCEPCVQHVIDQGDLNGLGYQGTLGTLYTTRLSLRYDPSTVDQDLTFSTTGDLSEIQQRIYTDERGARLSHPVCARGWDQAPLDCTGAVVAPGGPGPYLEGDLPPAPASEPEGCSLALTSGSTGGDGGSGGDGSTVTSPATTPSTSPPTATGPIPVDPTWGKGCRCDGSGVSAGGWAALALLALRRRSTPRSR